MPLSRSFFLLASMASLASGSELSPSLKYRHPALYSLLSAERRHLQGSAAAAAATTSSDGSGNDYGCKTVNGVHECKMSFNSGAYVIDESCTTKASGGILTCAVCTTDNESNSEFCYEFMCSADKVKHFDGDFKSDCTCASATVNGQFCSKCEFCVGHADEPQTENADYSKVSILKPPLSVECPATQLSESLHPVCPVPKEAFNDAPIRTETAELEGQSIAGGSSNGNSSSGGGMGAGGKAGSILVVFSIVGVVAFVIVKKKRSTPPPTPQGPSAMEWPAWTSPPTSPQGPSAMEWPAFEHNTHRHY